MNCPTTGNINFSPASGNYSTTVSIKYTWSQSNLQLLVTAHQYNAVSIGTTSWRARIWVKNGSTSSTVADSGNVSIPQWAVSPQGQYFGTAGTTITIASNQIGSSTKLCRVSGNTGTITIRCEITSASSSYPDYSQEHTASIAVPYYVFNYYDYDNTYQDPEQLVYLWDSSGQNTNVKLRSALSRTGYNFAGWRGDNNTLYSANTNYGIGVTITGGDHSFTAEYTANTYSISYTLNGGTHGSSHPNSATYDVAFTVNNPTRTGYTFTGWNITGMNSGVTHTYGSSTSTGTSFGPTTATSFKNLRSTAGTVTFTAQWTARTYTVTLDKQNGTGGTSSVTATYDSEMPSITVPTRQGYSFQGYYDGTNGTGTPYYTPTGTSANRYNKTSATTLYAYWFDGDSPENVVTGGYSSLSTTQTLTLSTSDISENIKYYWGTSSTGTPNITYSGEITKTISSAGTYYFITKDDTGNSATTTVYIYSYTIQNILEKTTGTTGTYNNSNYETQGNANTYIIRSTTATPSLFYNAPSNSIFKGWSTSFSSSTSSLSTSNISINSDNVTYYMWFNRNKYTVKYNANGGNGTMSNSVFKVGSSETLRLNSFTPQIGYTFGGWASSVANATAGTVLRANGAPHNNLSTIDGATFNLYAIWKFRGNYIYKNDTDKWVKVVPFVYDGSTWRETQPFIYTSNGWKSLVN